MKLRHLPRITAGLVVATSFVASVASAAGAVSGKASDGLVFVVPNEAGLDLWRARLADGALQRLSATPKQEERWPKWSEPARRLAFLARNTDGLMRSTVQLLDVEKGTEAGATAAPDLIQRSQVWSPDGKKLAYSFRMPSGEAKTKTEAGVAIVDVAKATREIVAEVEYTGYRMLTIRYAHDGKRLLAHGRNPKNASDDKIFLLEPGKKPRELGTIPRGIYARPEFTRDDNKIVFNYQQNRSRPRDLLMLEIGLGKRAVRTASQPLTDEHSAAPSPARDELVYVSDRNGSPNLFLLDLETGRPKILTKDPEFADTAPEWSPDGNLIAYVAMPADQFRAPEKSYADHVVRVIDRTGKLVFETKGIMPSFMPPWTGDQPVAPRAKAAATSP